jgi:hypothetical protein
VQKYKPERIFTKRKRILEFKKKKKILHIEKKRKIKQIKIRRKHAFIIQLIKDFYEIKNSILLITYIICLTLGYWRRTLHYPYFSFAEADLARNESVQVCPYNTL